MSEQNGGCLLHSEIAKVVGTIETNQREIFSRLLALERNESKRDEKLDNLIDIVKELKVKIDTLTQLPAQRWNSVVTVIITVVITTIMSSGITMIITKLIK